MTVLEARISFKENVMEELKKENKRKLHKAWKREKMTEHVAENVSTKIKVKFPFNFLTEKLNVLTVLEARMSASENLTEELKRENTGNLSESF